MGRFLLLIILLTQLAWAGDSEPSTISNDKPKGYWSYPVISIPLAEPGKLEYHDMVLTPNPALGEGSLQKRKFRKKKLQAGETLDLNTYLLADNIIEQARGALNKGPDFPTIKEIQDAFDGDDADKALKTILKLSEQRRGAYTQQELADALNYTQDEGDFFNDYLFGTGFVEVSSANFKTGNKDIRYFVPMAQVLSGNAKLNLKAAKLEVLRGFSVYMFRQLADAYESVEEGSTLESVRDELAALGQDTQGLCLGEHCSFPQNGALGSLMVDMVGIFKIGDDRMFVGANSSRLTFRKQMCVLNALLSYCPTADEAKRLGALVAKEQIDCKKPETLFNGLQEESFGE